MAAGKTRGRARRPSPAGHRRPGRRRADRGASSASRSRLLRARGRGGVPERARRSSSSSCSSGTAAVIALGGGAVESERGARGARPPHAVWCRVDEETAWERAPRARGRPLAADREEFARRFAERRPLYESVARAILPASAREAAARRRALAGRDARDAGRADDLGRVGDRAPTRRSSGEARLGLLGRRCEPDRRLFCVADPEALAATTGCCRPRGDDPVEGGEASKTLTEAEVLLRALAEAGARRDDADPRLRRRRRRRPRRASAPRPTSAECRSSRRRPPSSPRWTPPTAARPGWTCPRPRTTSAPSTMPLAVLADPAALATLPHEEIAAGFVEVVKTALIAGGELWERVRSTSSSSPATATPTAHGSRLRLRPHEDRRRRRRRARLRAPRRPQPRPHRRPRDRGGHRLRALPPRRGGRARPARGAAALGRRGAARGGRAMPSQLTTCRPRLDPTVDDGRRPRRDGARQEGDREGLGFVLLRTPGRAPLGRDGGAG